MIEVAEWSFRTPLAVAVPVLAVSHALVWWLARKVTIRLLSEQADDGGRSTMSPRRAWRSLDRHGRVAVTIMIAGALLIGMGVQQFMAQRASKELTACVVDWSTRFTDAIEQRSRIGSKVEEAQARLAEAQRAKDRALDSIVTTVILLRAVPPEATDEELSTSLARYADAKTRVDIAQARLDRVLGRLDETRRQNRIPEAPALVCD